jgi:hypothetical protein
MPPTFPTSSSARNAGAVGHERFIEFVVDKRDQAAVRQLASLLVLHRRVDQIRPSRTALIAAWCLFAAPTFGTILFK